MSAAGAGRDWGALITGKREETFTEEWVKHRFRDLAAEMIGLRDPSSAWLKARDTGTLTKQTLDYAKKMIPITDANAARLMDAALDGKLTYVAGTWHFYDGVCHRPLQGVPVPFWVVMAFAEEYSSAMDWVKNEIEAAAVRLAVPGQQTVAQVRQALRKEWAEYTNWDKSLRQNSGISGLKNVFQQVCTREDGYFDNDHQWLVCQNGILDLDEFRRNPSRPMKAFGPLDQRKPVARATTCALNIDARASRWEAFLESSIPDREVREFLQRLAGAALLGESKVKAIPNLKGEPDSGKSVFVDTLAEVFGGYAARPDGSAIQESRGDTNFERDDLRSKRFICISEPAADKRLDDGWVKGFTGGDMVKSRTLHQKGGAWRPQGIIFVASNHVLKLNTQDQAILDRLCLIEFPYRFRFAYEWERMGVPTEEWHIKDERLEVDLAEDDEKEGILLWAIRGAYMYLQAQGIMKPASVIKSGEQHAINSSRTLSWLESKIEEGLLEEAAAVGDRPVTRYVLAGKLYQAYAHECAMDNEKPLGKHAFTADLRRRYGELLKSGGVRVPRLVGVGNMIWLDGRQDAQSL